MLTISPKVWISLAVGLAICLPSHAKDLGKLECSENDGLKPDTKLLNLIISKCQPKKTHNETMVAACLVKCLMKQQKALDKKGKLKMKKAVEIVDVFPEDFKDRVTSKLNECSSAHNKGLKQEATGCDSWLPFSACFFEYSKELCPTEEQRKKMAAEPTTEAATGTESDATTEA